MSLSIFALNLLLSGLVSIVGYYFYYDKTYSLPMLGNRYLKEFPVFCEHLSLSPYDDDETFSGLKVSVNDDGRYVCSYKSEQMLRAIETVGIN